MYFVSSNKGKGPVVEWVTFTFERSCPEAQHAAPGFTSLYGNCQANLCDAKGWLEEFDCLDISPPHRQAQSWEAEDWPEVSGFKLLCSRPHLPLTCLPRTPRGVRLLDCAYANFHLPLS